MAKNPRRMRLSADHVALLPAKIDDPGPMPFESGGPTPDAYYLKAAADLIAAVPPGEDLWLFAFGSLIWNKRFDHVEERVGTARGWHRAFCLGPDTRYRGNPEAPGYMLGITRGGQCKGVVYRMSREGIEANLERLLRTEPPFPPVWMNVLTEKGPVRAFSFAVERKNPGYTGRLAPEVVADALAKSVGKFGSMAEYLHSTVRNLEELGISDSGLWRLQEMVAERIEAANPGRIKPGP